MATSCCKVRRRSRAKGLASLACAAAALLLPAAPCEAQQLPRFAVVRVPPKPAPGVSPKLSGDLRAAAASGGTFVGVTLEGQGVIEAPPGLSPPLVRDRIAAAGGETRILDGPVRRITDLIVSYTGAPPELSVAGVRTAATYPPGAFVVVQSESGFTPGQLNALAEPSAVQRVEPDYPFESFQSPGTIPNDPQFTRQWALAHVRAPAAWSIVRRTPIVVAVIDSGTDLGHPDLRDNLWTNAQNHHGYDFVAPDHDPSDTKGHGTHCAGIVAAEGDNTEGVAGVVWRGRIMSIRIFTGAGDTANASRAAMAIDFAVSNGARVLSLSWGGPNFPYELRKAIDRAIRHDAIIVAAAGNGGQDAVGDDNDRRPVYPGAYRSDQVVAVMSIGRSDDRSSFSNYGATTVHIAAPGENILTTAPLSTYAVKHGTSMATPFVAGAAALTWAHPAYSKLTAKEIVRTLLGHARRVPSLAGLSTTGGVLDLAFLGSVPSSPASPAPPPTTGRAGGPPSGKPPAAGGAASAGETVAGRWEGKLETGVFAIGGETTGIVLHTATDGAFELSIGDARLRSLAQEYNGRVVTVDGTLTVRKGVEVEVRRIIELTAIRPVR